MVLNDAQLEDIKVNYLEKKKAIREWMVANNLTMADVKPQAILVMLRDKYTPQVIQPLMQALNKANFGQQITQMTSRMVSMPNLSVDMCDNLIAKLQDAVVTVQAKKAELQG